MTSDDVLLKLTEEVGGKVHAVVSDMSPNISGHYSMDQANSVYLAEMALKTAETVPQSKRRQSQLHRVVCVTANRLHGVS